MANSGTITPEKTARDFDSRDPVLITAPVVGTVDLTRLLDTLHEYDERTEVLGVEQTDDGRGFRLLVDVRRGPTGVLPLRVATAPFHVKVETAKGDDITIRPTTQRQADSSSDYSLVVLGDPVTAQALARVTAEVSRLGGGVDTMRGMAHRPVTGLELRISLPRDIEREKVRSALTGVAATAGVGISVAAGDVDPGERRLVMFDVDATFILDEVIEKLAAKAGVEGEVKRLTEAAIGDRNSDFATLLEQRVALLAGLDESALDEVADSLTLTPGARAAVVMLEEMGHEWGLASGGFTRIIRRLMENEGLEPSFVEANELEVGPDGKLTGRLVGKIVDRAEKEKVLRRRAAEHGIPIEQTVAVGDGGNDSDGVVAAGVGVAFCAQQTLRDVADAVVLDRNLVAVMYAAGYTEADVQAANPDYATENAHAVGRPGGHCIRVAHSTHHAAASSRGDHRPVGGPGRGDGPGRSRGRARSRKSRSR